MNLYLMIAIVLANAIAIGIVYQFIKKMPKKEILIFLAVSVAFMYILVSIIYWISGFNIEENIHEETKSFVTYLFVPVNVILFIPYFASQYNKIKQKKIKREQLAKKLSIMAIFLVIVCVFEYFYFVKIQKNITNFGEEQQKINTIEQENTTLNETQINEISANELLESNIIANQL